MPSARQIWATPPVTITVLKLLLKYKAINEYTADFVLFAFPHSWI